MPLTAVPSDLYDPDLDGPREPTRTPTENNSMSNINPLTGRPKRPQKSSSFTAVVSDLEVGESASRTHALNENMTLAEFQRDMSDMKDQISNNVRPLVRKAQEATGGTYRVETSQTITTSGRIYLLAIVTRTS